MIKLILYTTIIFSSFYSFAAEPWVLKKGDKIIVSENIDLSEDYGDIYYYDGKKYSPEEFGEIKVMNGVFCHFWFAEGVMSFPSGTYFDIDKSLKSENFILTFLGYNGYKYPVYWLSCNNTDSRLNPTLKEVKETLSGYYKIVRGN